MLTWLSKAHPAFEVRRLNVLRQHLIEHNIQVINDDVKEQEDCQRFYASDPFGNRIEFIEWGESCDE
jgi:Ni2+-binding GTPase involved in maturation of urease and hydrogenase